MINIYTFNLTVGQAYFLHSFSGIHFCSSRKYLLMESVLNYVPRVPWCTSYMSSFTCSCRHTTSFQCRHHVVSTLKRLRVFTARALNFLRALRAISFLRALRAISFLRAFIFFVRTFIYVCMLIKLTPVEFRLLLILQTSGKTSADEWETRAGEWRRVKTNERPVQTSKARQRQMRDEYRRVKTNERQVQMSADEWKTSAILSLMNPESPTVFTSKRTCKFEIKPCVENFVLCVLIFSFLTHNTNAQFTEHDNAQATKN